MAKLKAARSPRDRGLVEVWGRDMSTISRADLRETRRARDRAVKLPATLVHELAEPDALDDAVGRYVEDVRQGTFPGDEESY